MTRTAVLAALGFSLGLIGCAHADVVTASPDHFTLKLEAETELSPDEVWARLIEPSTWWLSDHTYSGDSANLSIDPQPAACGASTRSLLVGMKIVQALGVFQEGYHARH